MLLTTPRALGFRLRTLGVFISRGSLGFGVDAKVLWFNTKCAEDEWVELPFGNVIEIVDLSIPLQRDFRKCDSKTATH